MKVKTSKETGEIVFSGDNADNMRKVLAKYKNIVVCGIKGVGKITNTVTAVRDNENVYYMGNPVDYEGKQRPGSYEKYLKYIQNLKRDIKITSRVDDLFKITTPIVLIIDEVYGRTDEEMDQIIHILDMKNIKVVQIVGCIKYMGRLIEKADIVIDLHLDGAFTMDKDLAIEICRIFGR